MTRPCPMTAGGGDGVGAPRPSGPARLPLRVLCSQEKQNSTSFGCYESFLLDHGQNITVQGKMWGFGAASSFPSDLRCLASLPWVMRVGRQAALGPVSPRAASSTIGSLWSGAALSSKVTSVWCLDPRTGIGPRTFAPVSHVWRRGHGSGTLGHPKPQQHKGEEQL